MNHTLLSATLALLFSLFCCSVKAAIYINNPRKFASCHGGQPCTVEWLDDGIAPLLTTIGICDVAVYANDVKIVQQIEPVDVAKSHSLTFTPNPQAGPNSDSYYIGFKPVSLPGNPSYIAFSAQFSLDGMQGSFSTPDPNATNPIPVPTSLSSSQTPSSTPSSPSASSSPGATQPSNPSANPSTSPSSNSASPSNGQAASANASGTNSPNNASGSLVTVVQTQVDSTTVPPSGFATAKTPSSTDDAAAATDTVVVVVKTQTPAPKATGTTKPSSGAVAKGAPVVLWAVALGLVGLLRL